jgi:hypothetical protein
MLSSISMRAMIGVAHLLPSQEVGDIFPAIPSRDLRFHIDLLQRYDLPRFLGRITPPKASKD